MSIVEFLLKKLAARRKRAQLREIESFIRQLEDQVTSGQAALRHWRAKADRIEAQLMLELSPDDIVRRSGAGA